MYSLKASALTESITDVSFHTFNNESELSFEEAND